MSGSSLAAIAVGFFLMCCPALGQAHSPEGAASSLRDVFINLPPEERVDAVVLARLDGWLPQAIERGGAGEHFSERQGEDVIALAKAMGYRGHEIWVRDGRDSEKLVTRFTASRAILFLREVARDDAVFENAAELPSTFDIFHTARTDQRAGQLAAMNREDRKTTHLRLPQVGMSLLQRKAAFETSAFHELDSWLPAALAGQRTMPDDVASQARLVDFAESIGWSNRPPWPGRADSDSRGSVQRGQYERSLRAAKSMPIDEKAVMALAYLQQNRFLQRSLIEGSEAGAARGRLIFEEDFVAKVVQFGVTQGLIAETTVADVRAAAATLFERADDAKFDDQRFARALAQQLALDDVALNRVIAGITYARRAETRADQHRRLAEVILAFKVKAEAGIGAMTPATWIQALADYSETLADLVGRRVEEPTRSGMANLLDHLGVPGYRMIDLSSKTILHLTNDRSGRVADLRVEKRRKGLGHLVFFDEGQKLVRP